MITDLGPICIQCGSTFTTVTVHHKIGRRTRWTVCPNGHPAPHSNPTTKPDTHLHLVTEGPS